MATVNKITVSTKGESHMNVNLEQKKLLASKIAAIPASSWEVMSSERFGGFEYRIFETVTNDHNIHIEIRKTVVVTTTPCVAIIRQVDSLGYIAATLVAPMQKILNSEQSANDHNICCVGKVAKGITTIELTDTVASISIDGVLCHVSTDIVLAAAIAKLDEITAICTSWPGDDQIKEFESIALTELIQSL